MEVYSYFMKLTPFHLETFHFYHVFAVVCIIYISAVLIKWSIKRNRWMRALEQFPGPPGHWLLGHVTEINYFSLHNQGCEIFCGLQVFDPLRFLPEITAKRSVHAFVPFSAGPRNYIGQNFALNEMKVVVALSLRKYVLIKDPVHTPKMIP